MNCFRLVLNWRVAVSTFAIILVFAMSISSVTFAIPGSDLGAKLYENDPATKKKSTTTDDLQKSAINILKFVGGWGGIVFTGAFMVLAMLLGAGGVNPHKRHRVYIGLVTTVVAAFIFFSAWQFAPAIANLAFE